MLVKVLAHVQLGLGTDYRTGELAHSSGRCREGTLRVRPVRPPARGDGPSRRVDLVEGETDVLVKTPESQVLFRMAHFLAAITRPFEQPFDLDGVLFPDQPIDIAVQSGDAPQEKVQPPAAIQPVGNRGRFK